MIPCRCGHGRGLHRPTANATRKRRRRGDSTPALPSCHARLTTRVGARLEVLECKCRRYVPAEAPR